MNLVIDIGNTRVKMGVFSGMELLHSEDSQDFELSRVEALSLRYGLSHAIISSTRKDVSMIAEALRGVVSDVLEFSNATPIPIKNSYATPETLGRDRLAAAVAAVVISDANNQLIVDMGTAITIDLVTADGGFEGGVISPGMTMRFRSLNEFTAALPLCDPTSEVLECARTTRDAIVEGVMQGIAYEIDGYIDEIRKKICEIDIIFTGGDVKYFENRIKNPIFAKRELLLVGLNRILEYNAK